MTLKRWYKIRLTKSMKMYSARMPLLRSDRPVAKIFPFKNTLMLHGFSRSPRMVAASNSCPSYVGGTTRNVTAAFSCELASPCRHPTRCLDSNVVVATAPTTTLLMSTSTSSIDCWIISGVLKLRRAMTLDFVYCALDASPRIGLMLGGWSGSYRI